MFARRVDDGEGELVRCVQYVILSYTAQQHPKARNRPNVYFEQHNSTESGFQEGCLRPKLVFLNPRPLGSRAVLLEDGLRA